MQSRVLRANREIDLTRMRSIFSGPAVLQQALEVLTFFCRGAGNRFIGVQPGEFPFHLGLDVTRIVLRLRGEGVQLIR